MKNNKKKIAYILLFLVVCLLPALLMPWFGHQGAESTSSVTRMPQLIKDGSFNWDFFSKVNSYFSENFAFRKNMVSITGDVERDVFKSSAQDNVIVGKNGYLFYGSSADDYQGVNGLNSRQLSNIAEDLSMLQSTLGSKGIDFEFTVAPNKNSLYGQYMPKRYKANVARRNITRLTPMLKDAGVNYVDLYKLFDRQKEVLYHKTDSHWNNKGADLVNRALLKNLGRTYTVYDQNKLDKKADFQGDLFAMICPAYKNGDTEYYFDNEKTYNYDSKINSTFDPLITTTNRSKTGSVVMFRDSFGNSLLPFTAADYGSGYFSRSMPIDPDVAVSSKADSVIWEIVERNLYLVQAEAPVIGNPEIADNKVSDFFIPGYSGTIKTQKKDGYLRVKGDLDRERTGNHTRAYILFTNGKSRYLYRAYGTNGSHKDGYGFDVYVKLAGLKAGDYDIELISEDYGTRQHTKVSTTCTVKNSDENAGKNIKPLGDIRGARAVAEKLKGQDVEKLIDSIGKPQSKTIGASCNDKYAEDGQYRWKNFTVYTHSQKKGGVQIIDIVK